MTSSPISAGARAASLRIKQAALLTALAAILQVLESFFPNPLPGVKLGLANMITLIALVELGFTAAVEIAILRTVISSIMLGTFLTPTFMLSFFSAITSSLAMGMVYELTVKKGRLLLSLTGISLLGAVVHILTQLGLVYLFLIRHAGIFAFLPVLGISAAITGWVNGVVASAVCKKLDSGEVLMPETSAPIAGPKKMPGGRSGKAAGSFLGRVPAELKILCVMAIALAVVLIANAYLYAVFIFTMTVTGLLSKAGLKEMFAGIWKLKYFVLVSFLIPALFGTSGKVLYSAGIIMITEEGMMKGVLFALRLIILMQASSLLIVSTLPENLANGLKNLLAPLGLFGIKSGRLGETIVLAWAVMPELWDRAADFIRFHRLPGKKADPKKIIEGISSFIAALYSETEKKAER